MNQLQAVRIDSANDTVKDAATRTIPNNDAMLSDSLLRVRRRNFRRSYAASIQPSHQCFPLVRFQAEIWHFIYPKIKD